LENVGDNHRLSLRVFDRENPAEELVVRAGVLEDYAGDTIVERLTLEGLAAGRYTLQVELSEASGQIVQRQSADFDISPRTSVLRPWVKRDSIYGEQVGLVKTALAEQYLRMGDLPRARELCRKAIEHNPELPMARLFLARMLLDEGDSSQARELLEPVHARMPENYAVTVTLGDACYEEQDYARAAELFESVLPLRRPEPSLLNSLAASLAGMGDTARAVDYLEQSLRLDPEQPDIRSFLQKLQKPK
jgi:predicted Zn-dependent protease